MVNLHLILLLIFWLSVADSENANINYDEVTTVHFPTDPCDSSPPEMPNFNTPGRRISDVKCLEYTWRVRYLEGSSDRSSNCDAITYGWHGVLGGNVAEEGEYAHMGAVGWKAKSGGWMFLCGSSLISPKYMLTAAHCSQVPSTRSDVVDIKPKIVRLGGRDIRDQSSTDVEIQDLIVYPRYSPPKQYYDIAIIKLMKETPFVHYIHPACLWNTFDTPASATLTGWGVIDTATLKTSPILQKADISLAQSTDCDEKLRIRRNRKWWGVGRHQLCAVDTTGSRIDSCQGDSGGPLQKRIPLRYAIPVTHWSMHHVIGVTSFGFGCARADFPGVYTRVASFVGWIEDIVWPQTEHPSANTSSAMPDSGAIIFRS